MLFIELYRLMHVKTHTYTRIGYNVRNSVYNVYFVYNAEEDRKFSTPRGRIRESDRALFVRRSKEAGRYLSQIL